MGAVEVVRVPDPGFELLLPQDDATRAILKATPWLFPEFVTDEQELRVGSSAIALRTPSATIVVDPFLAFDDPAKLAPRLAALRAEGVDPDSVDIVVCSHIDGIGANVMVDGAPAFPTARYLLPAAELADAQGGRHGEAGAALAALHDAGVLDAVDGGETLVPGVQLEDAPGHNPGNVVVWVRSGGQQAVVVGHTFLHPAQIANPEAVTGDLDPAALSRTRRSILDRCVAGDALLVGPLFAAPGGGKVRREGDAWRLDLATMAT